jgi:hypothetical protein
MAFMGCKRIGQTGPTIWQNGEFWIPEQFGLIGIPVAQWMNHVLLTMYSTSTSVIFGALFYHLIRAQGWANIFTLHLVSSLHAHGNKLSLRAGLGSYMIHEST